MAGIGVMQLGSSGGFAAADGGPRTALELLMASPLNQSSKLPRRKHGNPYSTQGKRALGESLGRSLRQPGLSASLPSLHSKGSPTSTAAAVDLLGVAGSPSGASQIRRQGSDPFLRKAGRSAMSSRNMALGDPKVERNLPRLLPKAAAGAAAAPPCTSPQRGRPPPPAEAAASPKASRAAAAEKEQRKAAGADPDERGPKQAEEFRALHEISSIAGGICKDLDAIMRRCDSLGDHGALDVSGLREICTVTQKVRDDLLQDEEARMSAAEEAAAPRAPYDDPVLAKARKIAALTNKLCEELNQTSQSFGVATRDSIEVDSLREISAVTKQVCENMRELQGESWAEGVLRASLGDEAAGEEAGTEGDKEPEAELGQGADDGDDGDGVIHTLTAQQEVAKHADEYLGKIPGIPDLEEMLANCNMEDTGLGPLTDKDIARMQVAFKRFKIPDSADLQASDVPALLKYLGHVMTKAEGITPLLKEVTSYEYLDFDEFVSFMEKYIPYEKEQVRLVFDSYDEDKSGGISITELKPLLLELGFIPLHAMIAECLRVVDKNGDADLNFDEFVVFLAVYRRAEGFCHSECLELRRIFDFFSKERGGRPGDALLPAECLSDALVQMFGLHVSEFSETMEEELRQGAGLQRNSSSKADSLTFGEFLIFARKTREEAMAKLKTEHGTDEEFRAGDANGDGLISVEELRVLLKKKGYTPLKQNLEEIFAAVDKNNDRSLDFNEFFDFMLIFQQREGFMKAVVEDLRRVFDRFDAEGCGEISALELAELFRQLGYRSTMDEIHIYVAQVDENNSGKLDFREYLRLMRLFREEELGKMQDVFDEHKQGEDTPVMPRSRLAKALETLEPKPPKALLQQAYDRHPEGVEFDQFVGLVDACRNDRVARERKKAGFADEKIQELKELFDRFDKDGGGEIDTMELLGLLQVFGWEPKTREDQQALMNKIETARQRAREAGVQDLADPGAPVVRFWSFVQLARMLETEHQHAEEERMLKLMQRLKFSQKEVEAFREIFLAKKQEHHDEAVAEGKPPPPPDGLPRDAVRRLIKALGVAIIGEKKPKLDEELTKLGCPEDGLLDFFGFLELMRWLMETGWLS